MNSIYKFNDCKLFKIFDENENNPKTINFIWNEFKITKNL